MIDDTLHCLAGGGTQLLRALPLLGGLFSPKLPPLSGSSDLVGV